MARLMKKLLPNQCRICGGPLHLSETERVKYSLSLTGEKETYEEEFFDVRLVCDVCHTEFDAEKKGNHYYLKNKLPITKKEIKYFNPFQIQIG